MGLSNKRLKQKPLLCSEIRGSEIPRKVPCLRTSCNYRTCPGNERPPARESGDLGPRGESSRVSLFEAQFSPVRQGQNPLSHPHPCCLWVSIRVTWDVSKKGRWPDPAPEVSTHWDGTEPCDVSIYLRLHCYRKIIQILVKDGKADFIQEDYSNGVLP